MERNCYSSLIFADVGWFRGRTLGVVSGVRVFVFGWGPELEASLRHLIQNFWLGIGLWSSELAWCAI